MKTNCTLKRYSNFNLKLGVRATLAIEAWHFFAKAHLRWIYIRSCHWQLFCNLCEQCSAFEALSLGNCITLVCAARHAQYSVQYQGRYLLKTENAFFHK